MDDSPLTAHWLGVTLYSIGDAVIATDAGARVTFMNPVVEALTRPQVVLLDTELPGMDGYEAARHLHRNPAHEGVRLVAMTGYGQDSDRARLKATGFDVHLVKPIEASDLRDLLAGVQPAHPCST